MPKKSKEPVVEKHLLIPKHSICSAKEKEAVLAQYNITIKGLPCIDAEDPAIFKLKPKGGDVIKIERDDDQAGKTVFYRAVIDNE